MKAAKRFLAGLGLALTGLLLLAAPALAGKSDNTLNMAWEKELESLDKYYQSAREGVILGDHIYDTLIYRDPDAGEYKGNLATSYKWVDSVTMDFELRQGVTFHNGDKFDADDVVFTFNHMADPASRVVVSRYVDWYKNMEKLGPYKVRLHFKKPFPAALEYLASPLSIYPHKYYQKVGTKGFGIKPIGTGPYMVTEVTPGKALTLVRFKNFHQDNPKGQPKIDKIFIRTIPEVATKVAEIMTGGLDWIWLVPKDQAEKLAQVPSLTVVGAETMRTALLCFLVADPAIDTPFKNLKVRQAVCHAVDRQAIVKNLVGGQSRVVNSPCYPKQFGCTEDGVVKYDYNPAKAKKLLAEAGYPGGFETDFYAYRDRSYAEATVNYLRQVGIKANLKYMQYSALRERYHARKCPVVFWTWGSNSIYDISAFVGHWFHYGADDMARDPKVKAWLDKGDTNIDPKVRKEAYKQALRILTEQAYSLPLFTYVSNYAFSKDLNFTPYPDDIPRFYKASWK